MMCSDVFCCAPPIHMGLTKPGNRAERNITQQGAVREALFRKSMAAAVRAAVTCGAVGWVAA
jgi:hypothetical protein